MQSLARISLQNILFLDIETVPVVYRFDELPPHLQQHWDDKTRFIQQRDGLTPSQTYAKAGIYAEFAKVVCISTAFFHESSHGLKLRVKSYSGEDEKVLLESFAKLLSRHFTGEDKYLCGHNIKEFDLPFISRRMIVHSIGLPRALDLSGLKPWEVRHIDTLDLWKFGDYKHFTSLSLLTALLGVPSPKDDISGADVGRVYWEEGDLDRIRVYCEKDTIAVAQLLLRFKYLPLLKDEAVEYVG